MKASTKRRRGKKQIEADKKLEEEKQQDVNNKLAQYAAMEARITEQEFQLNEPTKMHSEVNALVLDGILVADNQGNLDLNAGDQQFEQKVASKI